MSGRDSEQRFVDVGNVSLQPVNLLEVSLNALKLLLRLHVSDCSKISSVREVLSFFGAKINTMHNMVIIHRCQASNNVGNEAFAKDVKSVLFVHFNNTQVAIALSVE